jgi:hypothetical protein
MATQFFLRDVASDVVQGTDITKQARITRGAASVTKITNTVAGPTAGVQVTNGAGGAAIEWYSDPLRGGQSLSAANLVTFNIRALESATQANVGMQVRAELVDRFGNTISTIVDSERGIELGTTDAANNWTATPTATTINHGNRIKITVLGNDIGTMGSARTFTISYDGATAAAAGDSYVQFVETLTYGGQQYAQAQAKISPGRGQGYGQAQADIEATSTFSGQAQADILSVSSSFGQAQATIKAVSSSFGQAQALISGSFTGLTETFTRSVTDSWGTSDSGSTYTILTGAAADFDVDGQNGTIRNPSTSHHVRMPRVTHTPNVEVTFIYSANAIGSAHTTQFRTHLGSSDAADTFDSGLGINLVEATNQGHLDIEVNGQSTVTGGTISPLSAGVIYGIKYQAVVISSRILIRTKFWIIGFTEPYWSGASTEVPFTIPVGHMGLRTTGTTLANLLNFASITVTEGFLQGISQANADIKAIGSKFGQAKADIKTQGFGLGQAQAYIRPRTGSAQAQAFIKFNGGSAQAQALISGPYSYPVIDDFDRVVSNGLGTAPNGDSYSLVSGTASHANVDGSAATIQAEGAGGGNHEQALKGTLVSPSNGLQISYIASFNKIPSNQVSAGVTINGSEGTASNSEYAVNVSISGGTGILLFSINARRSNGINGFNTSDTNISYTINDQYQVISQIIKASGRPYTRTKIWKVGTLEPDWKETWDSNPPLELPISGHPAIVVSFDNEATPVTATIRSLKIIDAWITRSGQAQSDIKATGRSFGQAQADIKAVEQSYSQSQADILATNNQFSQSQADIQVTQYSFAQAQAKIINIAATETYASAQAQADIKAVGFGSGQSNADIKAVGNGLGQANADIKAVEQAYGQTQADIKSVGYGEAQANADIKVTQNSFAQSQADIKATQQGFGQAQADIKQTYTQSAQAIADIKSVGYGFAQAQAAIRGNAFAQAQADVKQTYTASGQANADIKVISNSSGQSQADIKATSTQSGQSIADIRVTQPTFGQAQADIKQIQYGFANSQADIKATASAFAQTNADVKATQKGFAQANADIKARGFGSGQSQADIKVTSFGSGQSQADIKVTGQAYSQANADIKASGYGFGQSQADIKSVGFGFGQAQATIRGNAFAQSQAAIKQTYQSYAQAQADIKSVGYGSGQANAAILGANQRYSQAQADIKAKENSFAQANADIKTTTFSSGQAQAAIATRQWLSGQAQASVQATQSGFSQSQADIRALGNSFAQANADIKHTYISSGQAAADIRTTTSQSAQAQAYIKLEGITASGQANSSIKQTYNSSAQASADIQQTYIINANAQADIKAQIIQVAQAQAYITTILVQTGQAQGAIATGGFSQAQTQALISLTGLNTYAQAQGFIVKPTSIAQAAALILQPHDLKDVNLGDRPTGGIRLRDRELELRVGDKSPKILLNDRQIFRLSISDRNVGL